MSAEGAKLLNSGGRYLAHICGGSITWESASIILYPCSMVKPVEFLRITQLIV
jgi:hypothetical protein